MRASSIFLPPGKCVYGGLVSDCLALQLSLHTAGGCGILDDRKQIQIFPRRLTFHIRVMKESPRVSLVSGGVAKRSAGFT